MFTLRKTEAQRDGSQTLFSGVDMSVGGRVFSSGGSMCSGAKYMTKGGSRVFIETNLNYRPSPPAGPIAARVRVVTIYSAEGHLESVSLFKERARAGECDSPPQKLPPHPCAVAVADEDFLAPGSARVDAQPSSLAGAWAGTAEALGPDRAYQSAACGRVALLDGGALALRDGPDGGVGGAREARAEPDAAAGRSCIALRAETGLEHMLLLGGGVFVRTPVVIDFAGEFCVELGWLVEPTRLLTVKRVYRQGAWVGSVFCDETKE